ncbi:MAG: hypothetical protein ABH891_07825 [Candidatus Omnitrophota bacterium]
MKRSSVASLTEALHKNKSRTAIYSLVLMIVAASSILFCEKEIPALGKKWRSLYELNEVWGYEHPKATDAGQPRDPTRYDIEVNLTRLACRRVEIRFCDRCSFILSGYSSPSGVYCKDGQGQEEYVSTIKYPLSPLCMIPGFNRSEGFQSRLKCNLTEKTVLVYMNGKFMEKIPLGPEPVNYNFGLFLPSQKEVTLNRLEILGPAGRILFNADFALLYFYKFISQMFLSLGVLIFLALGCSEKRFFRKLLFFVFPLFFLEAFLRVAYPHDPGLDIGQLKPKWRFEISTNFFGAFNDPKELTIKSYFGDRPNKYLIANSEHATRILCAGSSPLEIGALSLAQVFPALLEKKLNAWNQKKNMVIPLVLPGMNNFYSVEMNIYLKEVLNKMNPDFILFYGRLAYPKEENNKGRLEKDYALYQRAKRVMEKNSDWIKNGRLLYAALKFKEPIKEIVYLYDFLCKSYLFMAVENIRKRFLGAWHSGDRATSIENPDFLFKEVITLCKEKGIKVVFIPQLDFSTGLNDERTEIFLANLRREHPEIYYLNLEGIFNKNKNFLLAEAHSHPNRYGHKIIAQEIFRQLTEN